MIMNPPPAPMADPALQALAGEGTASGRDFGKEILK